MDSEIREMDTSGRMLLGYAVYWIDKDSDPTEMIFGKSVECYETWKQALKKAKDIVEQMSKRQVCSFVTPFLDVGQNTSFDHINVAEKHQTKECVDVLSKVDEDLQKDCWIYGGSKAYILKFQTDEVEYGTVYIVPVWQVIP